MKTVLDTSDRPAHDALVEKKSGFIADVCHVDALDEMMASHPEPPASPFSTCCGREI